MDGIAAHKVELAYAAVRWQRQAELDASEALFYLSMAVGCRLLNGRPYPQDVERANKYQRAAYYSALSARLHLFAFLDARAGG